MSSEPQYDTIRQPHLNREDVPARENRAKGNGALYIRMVYRSYRTEMTQDERSE